MEKNIDLEENSRNDEENLTLSQIFSILTRRSKLFGIVTLFFFSVSVLFTIYQRTTNPIFRGTFIIMTSDPVGKDDSGPLKPKDVALKSFTASSRVDFPTLRIFLKSSFALKSLADEMNLSLGFLEKVIKIKDEKLAKNPGSIVNVSINVKDYKLGKKVADKYLKK